MFVFLYRKSGAGGDGSEKEEEEKAGEDVMGEGVMGETGDNVEKERECEREEDEGETSDPSVVKRRPVRRCRRRRLQLLEE